MLLRRAQPLGSVAASALRRPATGAQRRSRSGSAKIQLQAAAAERESEAREAKLHKLELRLGYTFKDQTLLDAALTHPSALEGQPDAPRSRGRLEFLV